MAMKLTFLCCVAGELKDTLVGTTKNSRLFFYRSYENQTITDMKEDGFFNGAQELRVDDLIILYDPNINNEFEMVRIESMQGTVKTKKVDLPDIKKIYQILAKHHERLDNMYTKEEVDGIRDDLQQQIDKNAGEIAALDYDKASKETDFMTPVTPSNKGATHTEINDINKHISALEGVGGLLSPYDFGKTFENPISSESDIQAILSYFIEQIWEGATGIVFNTVDYAQTTFQDATGTTHTAAEIFNATAVTNSFDNTRIQLNNTQNTDPKVFEFTNQGILLVGIANETVAGIVRAGEKSQIVVDAATGDVMLDASKAEEIRETLGINKNSGSGHRNGEVFFVMRLDDLDGAVDTNGARYNLSDLGTGEGSLQDLLQRGALPYVSLAQHAATIGMYGSCRAFGWDGGDVVAVPCLKDVFIRAGTAQTPDEFIEAQIPNLIGKFAGGEARWSDFSGMYYKAGETGTGWGGGSVGWPIVGTDASLVSPVYKDGATTILPDCIRYRAMVQLFNGVTDDAVATCTGVLSDVAELKEKVAVAFAAGGRYLVRKKRPTDSDPTWYNVFSDGWVEQGGYLHTNTDTTIKITFPISHNNVAPKVFITRTWYSTMPNNSLGGRWDSVTDVTPTSFVAWGAYDGYGSYWHSQGYAAPSEYTRDKWGDDSDYSKVSVMTGDPSPFKFKAWTNAGGETVYTLLAVPIARGDDMYTEDQLGVYNEWDENQSTAPLPKVEDRCGAIGIVNGNRAINGGGVQMGTPGELDDATAYVRNQALDTNGPDRPPVEYKYKAWRLNNGQLVYTLSAKPTTNDIAYYYQNDNVLTGFMQYKISATSTNTITISAGSTQYVCTRYSLSDTNDITGNGDEPEKIKFYAWAFNNNRSDDNIGYTLTPFPTLDDKIYMKTAPLIEWFIGSTGESNGIPTISMKSGQTFYRVYDLDTSDIPGDDSSLVYKAWTGTSTADVYYTKESVPSVGDAVYSKSTGTMTQVGTVSNAGIGETGICRDITIDSLSITVYREPGKDTNG